MPFTGSDALTYDQVGNLIQKSQPQSPLYFLAEEHNALAPDRHLTMPAHKPLIIPVLITLAVRFPAHENPFQWIENELTFPQQAESLFVSHKNHTMTATLDGKNLNIIWAATPVFDLNIPNDNFLKDEIHQTGGAKAISEGYWVFLTGLTPGNHTLSTYGHFPGYFAGTTYHIRAYQ